MNRTTVQNYFNFDYERHVSGIPLVPERHRTSSVDLFSEILIMSKATIFDIT